MEIKGWRFGFHFCKMSEYHPLGIFVYTEVYNTEKGIWGEIQVGIDLIFISVGIRCERD